ncbi:MAG: PEPxxWA-CTERM sorting domain-containing protein [Phenylobacterium sp.]
MVDCQPAGKARQTRRSKLLTCVAVLAAAGLGLAGGEASAAVAGVTDDPVLYWNQVLSTGLAGSPTVTSRGFAMVDVAIYGAVNATSGFAGQTYLGVSGTPGGDTRAATSQAAHDVLVSLNPAKTAEFDAALAASLALVPDGVAKTNGIATGAAMAAATIASRTGDGSTAVVPYSPSGGIGDYALTPPALAPASLPQWGDVQPWLMTSDSQFRAGPPPAVGSAEYIAAYNEVMTLGALGSAIRTADQTASALFWAGAAGSGAWVQAGIDASLGEAMSSLQYASIFALLTTTLADTAISVWDTKYEYDYWRPITAIRLGDLDGVAATVGDATWNSLIAAPPHPSYESAHAAVAGAASTVLASAFGDDGNFCLTAGANSRCWDSFSDSATDAANSRLWGGIHWSFDNAAGLSAGRQLAQFAIAGNAFDAVPEPTSWAMMILGFAGIGTVIRRRRARGPEQLA